MSSFQGQTAYLAVAEALFKNIHTDTHSNTVHTHAEKKNLSTAIDGIFSHIHTNPPLRCQSEGNLSLPPFIFDCATPSPHFVSHLYSLATQKDTSQKGEPAMR